MDFRFDAVTCEGRAEEIRARLRAYLLTQREEEVICLIIQGLTNKEIASSCHICLQTVKDHLKHAYQKIGVHQRLAVIAEVLETAPPRKGPRREPKLASESARLARSV